MKASIALNAKAREALKKAVASKVAVNARQIVTTLHMRILERTPYNTGRTLGSWYGSAGSPVFIDIADTMGHDFGYDASLPRTNNVAVGRESGRGFYEQHSINTTNRINFEQNPYQKYFISNGARLDSGADFAPGIPSGLPQGTGSRAWAQEYGYIASYDLFHSSTGNKIHSFNPRGTSAVAMATLSILSIRRDFGRL